MPMFDYNVEEQVNDFVAAAIEQNLGSGIWTNLSIA